MRRYREADGKSLKTVALLEIGITERITHPSRPTSILKGERDAELMAAGCAKVFKEKVSGAKTDRSELANLIRRLERGDVLAVTRLDRLARSTRDLLNVIKEVSDHGAGFKGLNYIWADTTTAHGTADAGRAWRLSRVRARANPFAHGRGLQACKGSWCKIRPSPQNDAASAPGGTTAA